MSDRSLRSFLLVAALLAWGCGGSSPTELVSSDQVTVGDVIQALFLGTGPAHDFRSSEGCSQPGVWWGYARGSSVRIVISSTVSETARQTLIREMNAFAAATEGYLSISFVSSREEDPRPAPFEITTTDLPQEEVEQRCGGGAVVGCLRLVSANGPFLVSSQAVQSRDTTPGGVHVHEAAHGFGLCHVDARPLPGAVMNGRGRPGDHWTDLELEAIRAVYRSGLSPGASEDDFRRAGLIH